MKIFLIKDCNLLYTTYTHTHNSYFLSLHVDDDDEHDVVVYVQYHECHVNISSALFKSKLFSI